MAQLDADFERVGAKAAIAHSKDKRQSYFLFRAPSDFDFSMLEGVKIGDLTRGDGVCVALETNEEATKEATKKRKRSSYELVLDTQQSSINRLRPVTSNGTGNHFSGCFSVRSAQVRIDQQGSVSSSVAPEFLLEVPTSYKKVEQIRGLRLRSLPPGCTGTASASASASVETVEKEEKRQKQKKDKKERSKKDKKEKK